MVEHFDPDNYRDFLGSLGRFAYVAKDYVELAMQVYHSENFRIVRDRVRATPTTTYIKRAFNSYGDIATLFYDEQYEEAGEELVKALFPKRYRSHSNIHWDLAPPYNDYEGDVASGILAGLIYSMLGEKNYDNLAKCIHPVHEIDQSFGTTKAQSRQMRGAADHLMQKYNDEIWNAMVKMHRGFQNLDAYVAECNPQTKEQVAKLKESFGQPGNLEKAQIIRNLEESSRYVDKKVAYISLKNEMHNYFEMGQYVGEIYMQLVVYDEKKSNDYYRNRLEF